MLKRTEYVIIMPPDLALSLTLMNSNYSCLEHMYFHGAKGGRANEISVKYRTLGEKRLV